jgi:hypothetical protein
LISSIFSALLTMTVLRRARPETEEKAERKTASGRTFRVQA